MDILPAYNFLLGRPWIHSVGVVTSTLHQRLEFVVNNKLVVVEGEEDFVVSHLASFRYIEVEGKMKEIHFQSFEVVNVEMVNPFRDESKNVEFPMAFLKDAVIIIKEGHPQGWGRMLELPANKDRTGLGYNTQNLKKLALIVIKGPMLSLSEYFSSTGYLDDDRICVAEEDKEEDAGLIFTKTDGKGATKWTEIEIPEVTLIKM